MNRMRSRRSPRIEARWRTTSLALVVTSFASLLAQDATRSGAAFFPPTSTEIQSAWRRLDASLAAKDPAAALETLRELADEEDPAAIVSNDAGFSLGIGALVRTTVSGSLDESWQRRWRDERQARLEAAWREAAKDPGESSRERALAVRRRILREAPDSVLGRRALFEDLEERLLAGDRAGARERARGLLEVEPSTPPSVSRLRAVLLAAQLEAGDRDRLRSEARTLLDALGPGLPAELGQEGARLLAMEDRGNEAAVAGPGRPRSVNAFTRPESLTESGLTRPYRLGAVVFSEATTEPSLRLFLDERRRSYDGLSRTSTDAPIPFFATARGSILYAPFPDRLISIDTEAGTRRWSYELGLQDERFNDPRAPAVSSDTVYLAHGGVLHAVDAQRGEAVFRVRWRYDETTRRLRAQTETGPAARASAGVDERWPDAPPPLDFDPSERVAQARLTPVTLFGDDAVLGVHVRVENQVLVWLASVDRRGSLRWARFLGTARSADHLGLGAAGSPPLLRGLGPTSRIVYLSNLGFLASVDPVDGAIDWLREYRALTSQGLENAIRDENRWHVNPLVQISEREILFAPQDSGRLFALDVTSGAISWNVLREGQSTLLGANGELAFLGGSRLRAIRTHGERRGETAWSVEIGSVTGRAAPPTGETLLVSTGEALVTLSAADGTTLSRELWDARGVGGNPLPCGDRLAVVHGSGVHVYGTRSREEERIAQLTASHPEYWLRLARLRLRGGDLDGGLRALDSWLAAKPQTPQPNSPLDRLHLAVAEVIERVVPLAPDEFAPRLLALRTAIENEPERKVHAGIEEARWLEERDPSRALEAYHRALAFDARSEAAELGPRHVVAGFLPVNATEFIREQIRLLRLTHLNSPAITSRIEEQASLALLDARSKGSPGAFRDVLRRFPFTRAAVDAYREVVTSFLDHGNIDLASETLLRALDEFSTIPGTQSVRFALEAAQLLYEQRGVPTTRAHRRVRARQLYEQLLERHADVPAPPVPGAIRGETVGSFVRRRLGDPGLSELADTRSGLRVPLAMIWRSAADLLATDKAFLTPEGVPPLTATASFFTQSQETISSVDVANGLPQWTIHLSVVPEFVLDPSNPSFPTSRRGDREIRGRWARPALAAPDPTASETTAAASAEPILVLHDHRNVFAVRHSQGRVLWHLPFGLEDDQDASSPSGRLRFLRERIRGVRITDEGVYVTTSRERLLAIDLEGRVRWERDLGYTPSIDPPVTAGKEVFVLRRRPGAWIAFDRDSGEPRELFALPQPPNRIGFGALDPVAVGEGRVLFPNGEELLLLDLARRTTLWSFRTENQASIEAIFWDARSPTEVLLHLARQNDWPALVSLSLRDGRERWRYEKFPAQRTRLSVFRDSLPDGREQVYVIHGEEVWKLLALEIGPAPPGSRTPERAVVEAMWPSREAHLGSVITIGRGPELHIGENALVVPDPDLSISVFDRAQGALLNAGPNALTRFLVDKGSMRTALVAGRLIVLTDRGAAAFAGAPTDLRDMTHAAPSRLARVRRHLEHPEDADATIALALDYFATGELDTSLELLDRILRTEAFLANAPAADQERVALLLEGVHQEAMKNAPRRRIEARRLATKPSIDGVLDDSWSYARRLRITSPRNIQRIPTPTRSLDWEGEEDLSAVLYTGWDDEYFYFALDVADDVLRAYDRDAENWRGDCLLIGLDPEGDGGYHQGSDDQLLTLALTIPKRKKEKERDERKDGDPDAAEADDENSEDEEDSEESRNRPDGLYSVKRKDDNSGAIYECALPWKGFPRFSAPGTRPERGFGFGLSLLLTDDDSGYGTSGSGATKTLSIHPCHLIPREQRNIWVWRFLVPESFPRVELR